MNAELKTKWIEALRSGKYLQGQAWLRNGNKYCCLGVLCEVIDNTRWTEPDVSGRYGYGQWYHTSLLSPEVMFIAELSRNQEHGLIRRNDELQYTFSQIADHISANL